LNNKRKTQSKKGDDIADDVGTEAAEVAKTTFGRLKLSNLLLRLTQ